MNKPGKHGLSRIFWATYYSYKGIKAAWKNEAAFRQESLAMLIMMPFAFWLGNTGVEKALLIATCLFVIIVELLNSAIEAVVDRISSEKHTLSGQAKDMGSAAVLFSLCIVFITWGLIGYDNLIKTI